MSSSRKTHGLRGSALEAMINTTNEQYEEAGLALIQKIPTPITPVEMDQKKHITLAYFNQKSTVDYIGAVQGIPVCFDAKECAADTFTLQNIHAHQIKFMEHFEQQRGVAFFIVYYTQRDELYYIPFADMKRFWDRAYREGGRKSFRYEEVDKSFRITSHGRYVVPYLDTMQIDLDRRDD